MRGRQTLYPKFRRASNRRDGFSARLLRPLPVPVHRPAHEGRFFIGVRGPKGTDHGIEQPIVNDALDAHFGHLLRNTLGSDEGVGAGQRGKAAGAGRGEGAVGVLAQPPCTGVSDRRKNGVHV